MNSYYFSLCNMIWKEQGYFEETIVMIRRKFTSCNSYG